VVGTEDTVGYKAVGVSTLWVVCWWWRSWQWLAWTWNCTFSLISIFQQAAGTTHSLVTSENNID